MAFGCWCDRNYVCRLVGITERTTKKMTEKPYGCSTCGKEDYTLWSMRGGQRYRGCGHNEEGNCEHLGPAEFVPANDLTWKENLAVGTPQRCRTCGEDLKILLPTVMSCDDHYQIRVDSAAVWVSGCECGAFSTFDLEKVKKLHAAMGQYIRSKDGGNE